MNRDQVFFVVNASFFAALLISFALSYASATHIGIAVSRVPDRFHVPSQAAGLTGAATQTGDSDATSPLAAADDGTITPLHREAREAFDRGDVAAAIQRMERVTSETPGVVTAMNDLAVYYLAAGRAADAAAVLADAVTKDPSYARGHYNLGTLQLKSRDFVRAVASFDRALLLSPYDADARYNRALARTRLGDLAGAIDDYKALTTSTRTTAAAKAHYNLGLLYAKQGRSPDAIAAFRSALRMQPDYIEARFNAALLLARAGMENESIEEYRKVLSLRADHRAAGLNLGAMLMRKQDWSAATEHYEKLLAVLPNDPAVHYNLSLCRSHVGDSAGAIGALESAIRLDPSYVEARYNLALALADSGRSNEAIEHYRAAIAMKPDYFRAHYNLGLLEYRAQHYEAAARSFEQASRLRSDSYNATYNLGLALLKLDQPEKAEVALATARTLEETVEVDYSLGLALARQGRTKESVTLYHAALAIDPKHADSLKRMAEDLSAGGRHDAALAYLERSLKLEPTDPTAFNIGLRTYRDEQYRTALRYFEAGLQAEGPVRMKALAMKGATLARLGRSAEAIGVYEAALRENPDNASTTRNLARALSAQGQHDAALSRLDSLLAVAPDDADTLALIGEEQHALGQDALAIASLEKALKVTPGHAEALETLKRIMPTKKHDN